MADLSNGTSIVFNQDLFTGPDSDCPIQFLVRKGEDGKILRKGSFGFEYLVQPKSGNPFYCYRKEFDVCEKGGGNV